MLKPVLLAFAGILVLIACGTERDGDAGQAGVANVTATPGPDAITVEWSYSGDDTDGFDIYRQEDQGNLERIGSAAANERRYEDGSVTTGVSYRYAVTLSGDEPPPEPASEPVTPGDPENPGEPEYRLAIYRDGSGSGLVTSHPSGIDCDRHGDNCSHHFASGQTVTLSAAPSSASVFGGWSGCDRKIEADGAINCEVLMDEPRSVTVTFGELEHRLAVAKSGSGSGVVASVPAGIDCGSDCDATFADGTHVTMSAEPEGGSTFAGWSGCDTSQNARCEVEMTAARSVTATFETVSAADTVRLFVEKDGGGDGTVTSEPAAIDCGDTCSAEFEEGSAVTLTARPDENSTFHRFRGCEPEDGATCTVVLDDDATVTATFRPVRHRLATAVDGSGTVTSSPSGIDCPGDCEQEFARGTAVTLTATPSSGYDFAGWSGDCDDAEGNTCTVAIDGEKAVTAEFTPITHHVSVELSGGGAGRVVSSPTGIDCPDGPCDATYPDRETLTLTAEPSGDSRFAGFSSGCEEPSNDTCTLTVTGDVTIVARFDEAPDSETHLLNAWRQGPEERGRVTSEPQGIDCGDDCSHEFEHDTVVTLTARPAENGRFAGWGGDCSDAGEGETCTLTITQEMNVEFKFLPESVSASGDFECDGTFEATIEGNVTVLSGSQCVLIDSSVEGNVEADGATLLEIVSSTVDGNVEAERSGAVILSANDIDGNIILEDNETVEVFDNVVDGNIECDGNDSIAGGGNLVDGDALGQCSGL